MVPNFTVYSTASLRLHYQSQDLAFQARGTLRNHIIQTSATGKTSVSLFFLMRKLRQSSLSELAKIMQLAMVDNRLTPRALSQVTAAFKILVHNQP